MTASVMADVQTNKFKGHGQRHVIFAHGSNAMGSIEL